MRNAFRTYVGSVIASEGIQLVMIADSLSQRAGLSPLFKKKEQEIKETLSGFGIDVKEPIFHIERTEILMDQEKETLVSLNVGGLPGKKYGVEICALYKEEETIKRLLDILRKLEGVQEVREGTFSEILRQEKYAPELVNLSPHGRALQEDRTVNLCRKLYDPDTLDLLKKLISVFKSESFQADAIENEVAKNEEGKQLFERIFSDSDLIRKQYILSCDECGYPLNELSFDSRESAEQVLEKSSFKCPPPCGEKEATVTEMSKVTDEIVNIVSNGLWLECLIGQLIKEKARGTWIGVMHDTDELDVVSMIFGESTLFECKDASVGQNDIYSLMVKAEAIDANTIFVITTNPIHPNVRTHIEKYNSQKGSRLIRTVEGDSKKITEELCGILSNMEKRYLADVIRRHVFHAISEERFYDLLIDRLRGSQF